MQAGVTLYQAIYERQAELVAHGASPKQTLDAVARRSGCELLLDVSNVYFSAVNQAWDPQAYLAGFPLSQVREIHLAGHAREADELGRPLLIDAHDR